MTDSGIKHDADREMARAKVDTLLSGLKVGRLPDGTHFPSDIEAVLSFARWYASTLIAKAKAEERERCAGIAETKLRPYGSDLSIRDDIAKAIRGPTP